MAGELNLAPKRGANVWDRPTAGPSWRQFEPGYWVSMAGATALMSIGAWLAYWTVRAARVETGDRDDIVEHASAESFPASDPPSWT